MAGKLAQLWLGKVVRITQKSRAMKIKNNFVSH